MTHGRSKRILGIPDEFWIGFVIMVGFFLKLIYDIKLGWMSGTPGLGAWQDLDGNAFVPGGHLSVIQYYYTYHFFPGVDPRTASAFANPPLYYVTSAFLFAVFRNLLGWSVSISMHIVQCMNVIYVMIGECCGIGILQKYGFRGRKRVTAMLFLIFFPVFYNLSGALDGSAMCFMYMMLALNSSLNWYMSRREKTLRSAAIEIGLALLTSPAALMILPPVIYLIRKGAVDGRRNETPVADQAKRFAIITAAIGLPWQIYMLIRFRFPIFGIGTQGMTPVTGSVGDRIGIPALSMLTHIHTEGNAALESNIWAQALKTSAFDFRAVDTTQGKTYVIALILLVTLLIAVVVMHLMLVYVLLSMRLEHVYAMFLIIGEGTFLIGYVVMCFVYPYIEVMSARVFAPEMIFPLVGLMMCGGDSSDGKFEKITAAAAGIAIPVMSLIAAFLYGYYVV